MNRNKELEALERILSYVKLDEYDYETRGVGDAERLLKKALTPPTADEVIKALSEYCGKKVIFKENVFWYKTIIYDNEQWVRDVSLKDLSKDNRGDLITMIGKFYESSEDELK